jgi:thymidylate synthase
MNKVFIPDAGVVRVDTFSDMYPLVNYYIFTQKEYEESRDGKVKEVLDMKTTLLNPYRRCVGGCERDINIFFLLAEAMWIALGRKDVAFLTLFNKKMSDFSDDGKTFHAPYGYRLRHFGIRTEDSFVDDNLNASKGYDQVIDAIKIFTENPNSRQVVMSIWNPNFDLGYKTKDIPCNDMVMLKIRNGKLITTIQNRSNDLHWGLPTNIFQFSFLTELMAGVLGVELGTQTHNSQSLHIYEWNDIASKMSETFAKKRKGEDGIILSMYDEAEAQERRMDFNFSHEIPANRFREIEYNLSIVLNNLQRIAEGEKPNSDEIQQLANFSKYLFNSYHLLRIYLEYKHKMTFLKTVEEKDLARHTAISEIEVLEANMFDDEERGGDGFNWDISMLAKNFFASRLSVKVNHEYLGKL